MGLVCVCQRWRTETAGWWRVLSQRALRTDARSFQMKENIIRLWVKELDLLEMIFHTQLIVTVHSPKSQILLHVFNSCFCSFGFSSSPPVLMLLPWRHCLYWHFPWAASKSLHIPSLTHCSPGFGFWEVLVAMGCLVDSREFLLLLCSAPHD